MLTRKQEQGLKILESIVQSEYPFVVSLTLSKKHPFNTYESMLGIKLTIDPLTLSKYFDIPIADKFIENPRLWKFYVDDSDDISFVVHFFDDKYQDITGWRFNKEMEKFITKAYSQLPVNMRVNQYSNTPEDKIPEWALGALHKPRFINIDSINIAKDTNLPQYDD
jgi:hypothetical protein